jgi:nitroreductase
LRIVPQPIPGLRRAATWAIRDTVIGEGKVDFFRVLTVRRSVRLFEPRPIEVDKLRQVLAAIGRAPSAGNLQSYEVYMVRNALKRSDLVRAADDQEFLAAAPVVLVFCAHGGRAESRYGARGAELYCVQDATIACTFAMLAATALGLGSVWVGAFNEEAIKEIIGATPDEHPVALLPIGYGAEAPETKERRPLDEVVHEV